MDIRKLQRAIVDGLEDVKAQDISVFNTEHLSPLFERVIIASGTSNRQTKALAASVRDSVREQGFQVMRTEGEANGEWIIVDCGAAVAHIMQPSIRQYYHLEEIWGDKPVKLKSAGDGQRGLVKAEGAAEADEAEAGAPARKAAAKKASANKAGAGAAEPKPASGPQTAARKAALTTPAKKAAAKKAPAKKTAAKKVAAKKVAAKKAPTRTVTVTTGSVRPAAKKTAAKKVAAKTAPAKKVAAKQAAAKKAASRKA
ncbi:ribosome silencing factor [Aquabacterium sp. A7-Y]|uniref:ribosome silencing factor n=1 Tax=Aquabacterium sp. A7-Y TaxID=1349605 RepID=UPI00223E14E3|nr:ribosome silencing factor [Aquabacterium sp. A7-Y]MCW7539291.1 ribosome silencing factor [Aquabacterium sp. A7-Y]